MGIVVKILEIDTGLERRHCTVFYLSYYILHIYLYIK
jgi:hypothetical protein